MTTTSTLSRNPRTCHSEARGIAVSISSEPTADGMLHDSSTSNHSCHTYRVRITNNRDTDIRILRRRWLVIDGDGNQERMEGPGILGQIPTITAHTCWEYTSFCPLPTAWGTMEGSYLVDLGGDAQTASIEIPRFHLYPVSPEA